MKKYWLMILGLLIFTSAAITQEKGQFGFNLRVNGGTSIGAIYHVSQRLAFRPSLSFSSSKQEITIPNFTGMQVQEQKIELNQTMYGVGLSTLVYLKTEAEMRPYLGIDFTYHKIDFEALDFDLGLNRIVMQNSDADVYTLSGILGFQYRLSKQFNVFGEIGFSYTKNETPQLSTFVANERATVREFRLTNSGIGVIFYLN